MNHFVRVSEVPALRFYHRRLVTAPVHRRAFDQIGPGSVVVKRLILKGVAQMSIGAGSILGEGLWRPAQRGRGRGNSEVFGAVVAQNVRAGAVVAGMPARVEEKR